MNKYIDAEKLKVEIQKLRSGSCISESDDYYEYAKDDILDIIISLQQEQPKDIEEDFFFDEAMRVYDDNNKYPPSSEEELNMLEIIARHFYELGLNTRKEETK